MHGRCRNDPVLWDVTKNIQCWLGLRVTYFLHVVLLLGASYQQENPVTRVYRSLDAYHSNLQVFPLSTRCGQNLFSAHASGMTAAQMTSHSSLWLNRASRTKAKMMAEMRGCCMLTVSDYDSYESDIGNDEKSCHKSCRCRAHKWLVAEAKMKK
jgi:hypothetical protein